MKNAVLVAPATGLLMPITDVSDPIFAQKTMGEGFGVEPTSNQIVAPASGRIVLIADTKHAIGIRTDSGVEILIHMGIDTVELKGTPLKSIRMSTPKSTLAILSARWILKRFALLVRKRRLLSPSQTLPTF